jgi:hypothetical protein
VSRLDYDNDGDVDLLAASPHEGARLFRNDLTKKGGWLGLRLEGDADKNLNTAAFGTRVVVYADGNMYTRTLSTSAAGSRAATNSNELLFGLGTAAAIDSTVLYYPTGVTRTLTNLQPNHKYRIAYDGEVSTDISPLASAADWRIEHARYAGGVIRLQLAGEVPEHTLNVSVYDAIGRRVSRSSAIDVLGDVAIIRVHSMLPSGVYFLTAQSRSTTRTARVSITR